MCKEIIVIGEDLWGKFPMTTDRVTSRCTNPECPYNRKTDDASTR
jgi:hypothetical protein